MTFDQSASFMLLAGALILFAWGRWRYDVVAFMALLAAMLLGLVPLGEAFLGFGHPATVTVALVLIIGRGLSNSGAIDILAERGHPVDLMRLRAFPFSVEVDAFLRQHEIVFVVDQNRDGQLRTLLVNDTSAEKVKLRSVRHYSGTPLSADHVLDGVLPVLKPISDVAAGTGVSEPSRLPA